MGAREILSGFHLYHAFNAANLLLGKTNSNGGAQKKEKKNGYGQTSSCTQAGVMRATLQSVNYAVPAVAERIYQNNKFNLFMQLE